MKSIRSFFLLLGTGCFVAPVVYGQKAQFQLINNVVDRHAAERTRDAILAVSDDTFEAGRFVGRGAEPIKYRLLPPAALKPGEHYPLVVVYPSSGGIGTDNLNQMRVLVKYWAQSSIRERFPAYVLAVQFPVRSSNYAAGKDSVQVSEPAPCLQTSLALIDSLKAVLPVDVDRIYAVGFSMGASTTNNALVARPELFAAGVCLSGIPMQGGYAKLKDIPLWIVHGNADTENPIPGDRAFYRKMASLKQSQTLYWEIEGLQHEIYAPFYTTEMMARWLFEKKRVGH